MSGIGLCGAQRTGKTTLASTCAKEFGIPFLKTSLSEMFEEKGMDPKVKYDLKTNIEFQRHALKKSIELYQTAGQRTFITDRTPLDFIAYPMCDISRDTSNPELNADFIKYMGECIEAANKYFGVIILVQPGIKAVETKGSAGGNIAHMEHLNTVISGLFLNRSLTIQHTCIPSHILDMRKRVRCVSQSIIVAGDSFERYAVMRGAKIVSNLCH